MNAAACVVMALSTRDHVKPALKQLHWLPVEQRISYKLCFLMHYIHTGQAPLYLSNCVSTISSSGNRYRLRSCDTVTTYCREHAPSLANVVSTTPVRPPGTLCHLTYMTLLILTYSRNDLKLFCLIVRTDLLLLLYGAPGWFVERRLTNLSLYLYLYLLHRRHYVFVNVNANHQFMRRTTAKAANALNTLVSGKEESLQC